MNNASDWHRIRYAVWAPLYDPLVNSILRNERQRSMELVDIQPGERVLIVGAGTGLDLELIPPGSDISAIDITPAMVKRLQKRATRLGLAVDATVMDAQNLKYEDDSFDVVIVHFVLAVVPDPVKMMREVSRVLRGTGRVVVLNKFVPDDEKPALVMRMLNPLVRLCVTDLTCKLGPIVAASGMRVTYEEELGATRAFKVALLKN
jgi:phosphatidylethanolamine/phosphatidyl-N-methylethanolamine N-methyltransferase